MSAVVRLVDGSALSRAGRVRLAAEIVVTYLRVRWWLVRGGLPRALARARRPSVAPVSGNLSLESGIRLGHGVQRTLGALPADSRCLIRSLVLTRLLARRGSASTIVLAARSKPHFTAHAWVEQEGVPLLPTGSGFHRLREM